MSSYKINYIKISDPLYPEILKNIIDPPQGLYYIGTFPPPELYHLAVVGSRQSDNYGECAIKKILTPNLLEKVVVISGLAIGIDAAAHSIAKYTIAVLGSGLDELSFYPKNNWLLAQKIVKSKGVIISEYPPGTRPQAQNFPRRNRIIAGLSQAVLIIQAKIRSGALITSRLALESGRDVLAVPGSIFSKLSEGTNLLINQGATPITNSTELHEALNLYN